MAFRGQAKIQQFVGPLRKFKWGVVDTDEDRIETRWTSKGDARKDAIQQAERNPQTIFSIVKEEEAISIRKVSEVT